MEFPPLSPFENKTPTLWDLYNIKKVVWKLSQGDKEIALRRERYHASRHGFPLGLDWNMDGQMPPHIYMVPFFPDLISRVPQVSVAELELIPVDPGAEEPLSAPQYVKHNRDDGEIYYNKPWRFGRGFTREVNLLCMFYNSTQIARLRVCKLVGLVHLDSNGRTSLPVGILLENIQGAAPFLEAFKTASHNRKLKWMRQVEKTAERLHRYRAGWGNVHPRNIAIAHADDAVVTNFGGGCSVEYIDPENKDTVAGDIQGIRRMRAFLRDDERLASGEDVHFVMNP